VVFSGISGAGFLLSNFVNLDKIRDIPKSCQYPGLTGFLAIQVLIFKE
jgi:hypothetical protein